MTPQYQTPEKIKLKFEAIKEYKGFWQGKRILDIGCNEGMLYNHLKESDYTGIDTSKEYIKLAKLNYPEVDFRLMSFWDWSEPIDIAISLSTFHILNDTDFEKVVEKYAWLTDCLIMEFPVKGESPLYHARSEQQVKEVSKKYFTNVHCYGISPSPHDPKSTRKVFKCYG